MFTDTATQTEAADSPHPEAVRPPVRSSGPLHARMRRSSGGDRER